MKNKIKHIEESNGAQMMLWFGIVGLISRAEALGYVDEKKVGDFMNHLEYIINWDDKVNVVSEFTRRLKKTKIGKWLKEVRYKEDYRATKIMFIFKEGFRSEKSFINTAIKIKRELYMLTGRVVEFLYVIDSKHLDMKSVRCDYPLVSSFN